jgi:hypothetical protein
VENPVQRGISLVGGDTNKNILDATKNFQQVRQMALLQKSFAA